eukprot:148474_1
MSQQRYERVKLSLMRMVQKDMRIHRKKRKIRRLRQKHNVLPTKPQDWQIVKGDMVEVIRGRDEGKQGKVLRVHRFAQAAAIEGCNLRLKKTRGSAGEIVTQFRPSKILIKHLALVDQDTNLPTKVEWKYQQTAIDTERYQRVRQSVVSGDIMGKPKEAKVKRKIREVHSTKDTPTRMANLRTWIGPWEFFTQEQKEFIVEDTKDKIDLPNLQSKLPELMYNNVEEVQEYIRMLPYCPHTFFKPGNCAPHSYEKPFIKRWSNRRLKRELKLEDGKRDIDREDLKEQLETYDRSTYPIYLTNKIDPDHHWPRVKPEIDPKFQMFHKYLRQYSDEDEVMRVLDEEFGDERGDNDMDEEDDDVEEDSEDEIEFNEGKDEKV